MRVLTVVPRVVLPGLGLLLVTLFVQSAKADTIDFGCGGGQACTGVVVQSGSNYSSTGISVTGSYDSDPFTLVFDSNDDMISITENGGPDQFSGTITTLTATSSDGFTTLELGVDWTSIPSDLGNWGITPDPSGSIVSITISGSALSVDIPIETPEPAASLLLSGGLVVLCLIYKRKAGVLA